MSVIGLEIDTSFILTNWPEVLREINLTLNNVYIIIFPYPIPEGSIWISFFVELQSVYQDLTGIL